MHVAGIELQGVYNHWNPLLSFVYKMIDSVASLLTLGNTELFYDKSSAKSKMTEKTPLWILHSFHWNHIRVHTFCNGKCQKLIRTWSCLKQRQ